MKVDGKLYVVYHSDHPERIRYGGKTTGTLRRRSQGHWSDTNRARTNSRMHNWLVKHRLERDKIVFEEYSRHETVEELNAAEIRMIADFRARGQMDLNITDGGDGGLGTRWTEESKAKLRETLRGPGAWKAQFTWEQVRDMRAAYLEGGRLRDLMAEYGCPRGTMQKILRNTTWTDEGYTPPTKEQIDLRGDTASQSDAALLAVEPLRRRAAQELKTQAEWGREFNLTKGQVRGILGNINYRDPSFDPSTVLRHTSNFQKAISV